MRNVNIVKLDRRHKKYKDGFTHAFRFEHGFCYDAIKCEQILQNMYPDNRSYSANPDHFSYSWGSNRARRPRIYWLNVKRESDITMVLLSLDIELD